MSDLNHLTKAGLASVLGTTLDRLSDFAARPEMHYKRKLIARRHKLRRLLIPDEELKRVQLQIYRKLLRGLAYHPAVYCCKGRGAVVAASRHTGHPYILSLDLVDFFPRTNIQHVRSALRRIKVSEEVMPLLLRLVTCENQLPQGAPTSVAIGNLVLHAIDTRLWTLCRPRGLTYTRYIDDLVISGGSRVQGHKGLLKRIVEDYGWEVNVKGGIKSPSQRHTVLRIIVNRTLNVDPAYIAEMRWLLGRAARGVFTLSLSQLASIKGTVGWITLVNPQAGAPLQQKLEALG